MQECRIGMVNRPVQALHQGWENRESRGWRQYGARRHIRLVIPFIKPDSMGRRRMQRGGPGDGAVLSLVADMGGKANGVADVCLAFKIIKRLYGKEYAVHPDEQGIEKQPMYPFFHFTCQDAKIAIKNHVSFRGPAI